LTRSTRSGTAGAAATVRSVRHALQSARNHITPRHACASAFRAQRHHLSIDCSIFPARTQRKRNAGSAAYKKFC